MPSEYPVSTSIIPAKDGAIKDIMLGLLKGLPTRTRNFGLSVSEEVTTEEVVTITRRILTTEKQVTVRSRFYLGDL